MWVCQLLHFIQTQINDSPPFFTGLHFFIRKIMEVLKLNPKQGPIFLLLDIKKTNIILLLSFPKTNYQSRLLPLLYYNNMNNLDHHHNQGANQGHLKDRSYKRYRYCCRKCKHTERGKKSCVCVVPLTQRRTNLTDIGCQTCGCKGCSIEDYQKRGEDPEYRSSRIERRDSQQSIRNLCCKKCSSSKMHKRCVCQLPKNRRRNKLPPKGCKCCGCMGCNPKQQQSQSSSSPSRNKSEESQVNLVFNQMQMNFNNIDRSLLGRVVIMQYSLNPAMLGLGIPQRTPSYILGKSLQ